MTEHQLQRRVLVDMSATLIHHGHIRLLAAASELGRVIVGLTLDEEVESRKGYAPELAFEHRRELLLAIRYVDEVIPAPWLITDDFLKAHQIDLLVHGDDNNNNVSPERTILLPRTDGVSSSWLRRQVLHAVGQIIAKEK